jgi:import inner membrane translocase subunit TIM22
MPPSNRRPLYTDEEAAEVVVDATPGDTTLTLEAAAAGAGASSAAAIVLPADTLMITDQPCTLKGLGSAAGAGVLGYLLGVVPAAIRHRARQWALTHRAGTASASQLALMSGLYTTIHCICSRLRQQDDGWNRGVAGCATGLALGWSNGPAAALQSCIGIGAISYLIDFGPTTQPAAAAEAAGHTDHHTHSSSSSYAAQQHQQPSSWGCCSSSAGCCLIPDWGGAQPPRLALPSPAALAAAPPIQWLGHLWQQHGGVF